MITKDVNKGFQDQYNKNVILNNIDTVLQAIPPDNNIKLDILNIQNVVFDMLNVVTTSNEVYEIWQQYSVDNDTAWLKTYTERDIMECFVNFINSK